MSLMECLEKANLPKNQTVLDNFIRAHKIVNDPRYKNILCSVSGGSDSDDMLDIIHKVDEQNKVRYVWFDTGLEYQATKDHLLYLEQKYNIKIERERAIKPIPTTCKEYGQPFLSKYASDMISRLQKVDFKWEDKSYEELSLEYKNVTGPLKWWCNMNDKVHMNDYGFSRFNISFNKYLKEFLILNPPSFKISADCCKYAKKDVVQELMNKYDADLSIVGVRKVEGGIRSAAYENCFSEDLHGYSQYRPLWWYKNEDKYEYEKQNRIKHSNCYIVYGFKRTGCCCCPYGRDLFKELSVTQKYEPKLYKAVNNVFKDSYEYTRQYLQFRKEMKDKEKGRKRIF